jgi:hypothetical protein
LKVYIIADLKVYIIADLKVYIISNWKPWFVQRLCVLSICWDESVCYLLK